MNDGAKPHRIMLMSGFLGSGKTTSMTALAKCLAARGEKACLITNDLGENLVDTQYVEKSGIPVLEIANGCLCHDVDQLTEKIDRHIAEHDPDIVVFEPVGACVDMVAHVYEDIAARFPDHYVLAPVSAIIDPVRYQTIYMGIGENTFPDYTSYMLKKQLEEADLLIVNKIDLISADELAAIVKHLSSTFPGIPVVAMSAIDGTGVDAWVDLVMGTESSMIHIDIDMDYVMNGAAKMGWYNRVSKATSQQEVDYAAFGSRYLRLVRDHIADKGVEIAHLKIIATQGDAFCKTAITTRNSEPNTVGALSTSGDVALNTNIRAIMPADDLKGLMESCFQEVIEEFGILLSNQREQTFSSDTPAPDAAVVEAR